MNDLRNCSSSSSSGSPSPSRAQGAATLGAWHDEVMHAKGFAEAAILTSASFMIDLVKVLLIFLFGFPLPYSGTGATAPGA